VQLQLAGRRRMEAVTYIADRDHEQYAGTLDALAAARVVNEAKGQSGPNDAYVFNTLTHLKQMGIRDHWLEQVVDEVERLRAA
jgi:cation transport protein ChaC